MAKSTIYQQVTDKIIAQLEAGILPWVQPWKTRDFSIPKNGVSDRHYSGINILLLWLSASDNAFKSNTWLTFKQAAKLGGNVIKGNQGRVCLKLHT